MLHNKPSLLKPKSIPKFLHFSTFLHCNLDTPISLSHTGLTMALFGGNQIHPTSPLYPLCVPWDLFAHITIPSNPGHVPGCTIVANNDIYRLKIGEKMAFWYCAIVTKNDRIYRQKLWNEMKFWYLIFSNQLILCISKGYVDVRNTDQF